MYTKLCPCTYRDTGVEVDEGVIALARKIIEAIPVDALPWKFHGPCGVTVGGVGSATAYYVTADRMIAAVTQHSPSGEMTVREDAGEDHLSYETYPALIVAAGEACRKWPDILPEDEREWDIQIDGGEGGDTTIEADSLDEALDLGCDWAEDGDWGEAGTVKCDIRATCLGLPTLTDSRTHEWEYGSEEDAE